MVFVIQFLTSLFILLSLGLSLTVPLALAIPGQWNTTYKSRLVKSTSVWTLLIVLITFFNTFAKT